MRKWDGEKLPKETLAEIRNFHGETVMRLVFESNRMEDAGLDEGGTKKLLGQEKELITAWDSTKGWRRMSLDRFLDEKYSRERIAAYGDRAKASQEVIRHALAWNAGHFRTINYRAGKFDRLFAERPLLQMHDFMLHDLIPMEWGLQAGHYRNGPCHTNHETFFTSWENIPAAMKDWVKRANDLMGSDENPVMKAAKISYQFVAIHPFPDGNGRMSRLIMNMALGAEGLPFLAVLKGNKKEKHRYITALRHANRGKLASYAALIARAVNEGFDDLNLKLELAGLKPIRV
jgi:Fic family protein